MAIIIKAASPIWKLIILSSSVLGGILLVGGIVLAILGGSAQTAFTLFGNQFSSTSVGVSLAFIGAVIVVIVLRRVLTSVDKITSGGDSPDKRAS
jgi:membrane protein implicated in regulation of membrane protease activity